MSTIAYTSLQNQPSLIEAMKDLNETTRLLSTAQAIRYMESVSVINYAPAPYKDVLRQVNAILKAHYKATQTIEDLSVWKQEKEKAHPLIRNVLRLSDKFGNRLSFCGILQNTCCTQCRLTTSCKEWYILDHWGSKFNYRYPTEQEAPPIEAMH